MEFAKNAARAAYDMIEDGMVISLGNGNAILELAALLKKHPKEVAITTTCLPTKKVCREFGFKIIDSRFLDHIDIAFDTCDEIDEDFNILKSTSGFHTRARIHADMADQYVVIADTPQCNAKLHFRHPVCLEVLQPALSSVIKDRRSHGVGTYVRENMDDRNLMHSPDGNYLVNMRLRQVDDLEQLNRELNDLPGVVDHSLFLGLADVLITRGQDGIEIRYKPNKNDSREDNSKDMDETYQG